MRTCVPEMNVPSAQVWLERSLHQPVPCGTECPDPGNQVQQQTPIIGDADGFMVGGFQHIAAIDSSYGLVSLHPQS